MGYPRGRSRLVGWECGWHLHRSARAGRVAGDDALLLRAPAPDLIRSGAGAETLVAQVEIATPPCFPSQQKGRPVDHNAALDRQPYKSGVRRESSAMRVYGRSISGHDSGRSAPIE